MKKEQEYKDFLKWYEKNEPLLRHYPFMAAMYSAYKAGREYK